jgi:glycosyltransferase involved in cell wall biosynthesis
MYKKLKIGLVIPAYNEERLLKPTLDNVPQTVDIIIVVDDCSTDNMPQVLKNHMMNDKRIVGIKHKKNKGVGQGIITGYKEAVKQGCDVAVVIGGDNQMDLMDLSNFLEPIHKNEADYVKGNRFMFDHAMKYQGTEDGSAFKVMPRQRFFGNSVLSFIAKWASGYWNIFDTQDGYTAITKAAIQRVDWEKAWKGYGYVGDWFSLFNVYNLRIKDVPRKAVYLKGERQSQIKLGRYIRTVLPRMVKSFFWRIKTKYIYQDFHPLILFYILGLLLLPIGMILGLYLLLKWLIFFGNIDISGTKAILTALFIITGIQSIFFAVWFDMEANKHLQN